jgi:ABC-type multidrug transport system fused ATPase/permease subunit
MKDLLHKFRFQTITMAIILTLLTAAEIATSFTLSHTVNAMIEQNFDNFIQAIVLTFSIYLVFLLITYIVIIFQSKTNEAMKIYLRDKVVDRLAHTEYQGYHDNKPSTYSSWLMNDVNQISSESLRPFYELMAGIISLVISIITLLALHWVLLAYTLLSLGLMMLVPKLFNKVITSASVKLTSQNEIYLNKITDYLNAYDTLFSYRQLPYMQKQLNEQAKELAGVSFSYQKIIALVAVAGGFGNILGQIGIFAVTGYLVLNGQLSVGSIMVTTTLAGNVFNTAGNLSQYISQIQSSKPIFEKFEGIKISERSTRMGHSSSTLEDGYVLKNVNFSYDDKQIIDNLTLKLELAKNYAIIGESGSGKSTLLNLIGGRLDNYQGSITLNGKEINREIYDQLYNHVLYIDQNPHIFDGTIRENLEMGQSYTDEELWEVLSKVHLKDLVSSTNEGLDYYIGESGKLLSGGQKQRLSIARSLLRNKKILLLDEVTSSLDHDTAVSIEKLLLSEDETGVIMITHNLREETADKIDYKIELT